MKQVLLSIENLTIGIPIGDHMMKPVNDVSFQVDDGEALGLVGESGCGKTMTAMSILRLLPRVARIRGGRVLFKGQNLIDLPPEELRTIRGSEISIIFQDPRGALDPIYRVGELTREPLKIHDRPKDKTRVVDLLRSVEIPAPEHTQLSYPFQLSEGMCQRVMAAVSLACEPSLLIADEPTTNLDVTIQAAFMKLLKKLRDTTNITILFISHNLNLVRELCDKVAIMYAGTIVERGSAEIVMKSPKHPYMIALLNCMHTFGSSTKKLKAIPGKVPELSDFPTGCVFHPRCAHSMEKCKTKTPNETYVNGRMVRCFLYEGLE